ncbi:MAG: nitronate monooxygenase [Bacillaceae bacterium]|nr:nitronate monooxygenase [Bacillaceae bacterium]
MNNPLCRALNLKYPIILGGMGNISSPELAAAVSEAGGLGTIGSGTLSPDQFEQKLQKLQSSTTKPYSVNIPITVQPHVKEIVDLATRYEVPVISLSAGKPDDLIRHFKQKGLKTIVVVGTVKHAIKAEKAGADAVVAEGFEAAGINSPAELTTMTLIPQVADAVSIPVVAAGGIGNERGLAAALALGASGVQMGTRFVATKEAVVHQLYKEKILEAKDTDTRVVGRKWGVVRRLLDTPYTRYLMEGEAGDWTEQDFAAHTDEDSHYRGAVEGRLSEGHINSGQISGLIRDIPTVQELMEEMIDGVDRVIKHISTQLT